MSQSNRMHVARQFNQANWCGAKSSLFFLFVFSTGWHAEKPQVSLSIINFTSRRSRFRQRKGGWKKKMKRWEGKRSCNQKWKLKENDGRQRNKWQDRRNADLAKNIKWPESAVFRRVSIIRSFWLSFSLIPILSFFMCGRSVIDRWQI